MKHQNNLEKNISEIVEIDIKIQFYCSRRNFSEFLIPPPLYNFEMNVQENNVHSLEES